MVSDAELAASLSSPVGAVVEQHSPEPNLLLTLVSLTGTNDPDTGDIYAGVDHFGRVKDLRWRNVAAGADLSRVQYGYDRDSNRVWRANPSDPAHGQDWLYDYEGLQRLDRALRGTLTAGHTEITALEFAQCWNLDSTGNWRGFRQDNHGDGWDLIQTRSADMANEITGITNTVGAAWVTPVYDAAGNMTTIPQPNDPTTSFTATYDAWNRQVHLADGGDVSVSHAYDAGGYRLTQGDGSTVRHFYYSNRWRVVEERLSTGGSAERQFIWGRRYIDDLILRDRGASGASSSSSSSGGRFLGERLYALQDGNWNVTAVVDAAGSVQERYEYDPYGNLSVLDPEFGTRTVSGFDWETTYCGYRWDAAMGLYVVRFRILQPMLGWVQRDPIGYADSSRLSEYCTSIPTGYSDSYGLQRNGTPMKRRPQLSPVPTAPPPGLPPTTPGNLNPGTPMKAPPRNVPMPPYRPFLDFPTGANAVQSRLDHLRCIMQGLLAAVEAGHGFLPPAGSFYFQYW